ncbi:MAG: 50S ribosomal protein L11 methyltransferase [Silicimonas sp.]|jgi:ribosomal protein L11 methyltransferase|nr:50S ribosomal protein L11 methyltransferase [Silicimonas sp.]
MATWTAFTTLSGKPRAEALGLALEAVDPEPAGVGVFEIEDGSDTCEVGGYFTEAPDEVALALLAAAYGAAEFAVSELPETDWVAHVKRTLAPVEAGRFFVYGSHDADRVPADRIGLLIEAAMAFGTGHHGTTLGCLRAIDRLAEQGIEPDQIADIGCGSGVLAMAAARVWSGGIIAADIDPVAIEVTQANLAANGMADRVDTCVAPGFEDPRLRGPFDLVFANILKGPLIDLARPMAAATAPGGVAVLSGLLVEQAEDVIAHYRGAGFSLMAREDIVDWTTLILGLGDRIPHEF